MEKKGKGRFSVKEVEKGVTVWNSRRVTPAGTSTEKLYSLTLFVGSPEETSESRVKEYQTVVLDVVNRQVGCTEEGNTVLENRDGWLVNQSSYVGSQS